MDEFNSLQVVKANNAIQAFKPPSWSDSNYNTRIQAS